MFELNKLLSLRKGKFMNLKEKFDEWIDFIDSKKKIIITTSLSILGFIVLIIIFLVSSDELSVSKESNILVKNIIACYSQKHFPFSDILGRKRYAETKLSKISSSLT